MHKVIDNFLPEDVFVPIEKLIEDKSFPLFFNKNVGSLEDFSDHYFIHTFYYKTINSQFWHIVEPLCNALDAKAIIRVRLNFYNKSEKIIEHGQHRDYDFPHKSAVFYINTNNGFTRLDDDNVVMSVRNRILIHDGDKLHNSTNCTDKFARLVIVVNYF